MRAGGGPFHLSFLLFVNGFRPYIEAWPAVCPFFEFHSPPGWVP